jgi:uncharacterized protein (TIGR03435 family)
MDVARFDVSATLPSGAKPEQLPEMLQHMLTDRFGLRIHRDTRTVPVFSLTAAEGGAKMLRGPDDEPSAVSPGGKTEAARIERTGRMLDRIWSLAEEDLGVRMLRTSGDRLRVEFTKMPMAALAQILASYLRAPVLDETGLNGNYQAVLEFSVAEMERGEAPNTLLAAVGRLGLRLERRRTPVEIVVVDSLLRTPSAN